LTAVKQQPLNLHACNADRLCFETHTKGILSWQGPIMIHQAFSMHFVWKCMRRVSCPSYLLKAHFVRENLKKLQPDLSYSTLSHSIHSYSTLIYSTLSYSALSYLCCFALGKTLSYSALSYSSVRDILTYSTLGYSALGFCTISYFIFLGESLFVYPKISD